MDTLLDYLRRCGGADLLVFDDSVKAAKAREYIQHICEEEDIELSVRPSCDLFDNVLRLRLRTAKETDREPTEPLEKVLH